MDLTHKDENTESTEERTIMMDSIKALHTGEVRNEDSSYDSGYESVPGGEESHSGDGEPAEDEVTEKNIRNILRQKKNATRKSKQKTATGEHFHIFSQAFCCLFSSYRFLRFLLHTL